MMFSLRRLLPLSLLVLLIWLLAAEARRYDDSNHEGADLSYHRHRHHHELANPRRPHALPPSPRKRHDERQSSPGRGNDSDDDYDSFDYDEFADDEDSSEELADDEGEEEREEGGDYERRAGRYNGPKRLSGNHRGRYEPRYPPAAPPPRYYHRASSSPAHHAARGHEARGHERAPGHHRTSSRGQHPKRYRDEDGEDGYAERAAARRRYQDAEDSQSDSAEYYYGKHKPANSRKRLTAHLADVPAWKPRHEPRKDRRHKLDAVEDDYPYDSDVEDEGEEDEAEEESRSRKHGPRRNGRVHLDKADRDKSVRDRRPSNKFDDWFTRVRNNESRSSAYDSARRRGSRGPASRREEESDELEDEDEEVELWKDDGDEGKAEEHELDNDFYKSDSSLKTFDDIIRRLTEERTTTAKPARRRNAERESHPRPDGSESPRLFNSRRNGSHLLSRLAPSTSRVENLVDEDDDDLSVSETNNKNSLKKRKNFVEEENDEEDERIQADTNTDYVDDENDEDEESSSPASTTSTTTSTSTPASTTTSTTTSSTTSTTLRSIISSIRKDNPRPPYEPMSTGSQYNGYQAKNDYPPMSEHSAFKWKFLGTRESVKETRNNMSQFAHEMHAAHIHALRVAREGSCQLPKSKIIPVHDIYPNSTATYVPHCAILHRCSDDTGCCRSETFTCQAKQTQRVELYFYATYVHGKTEIEKLSFINHTECECVERKDFGSNGGDRLTDHRTRHYPLGTPPQNILRVPPPPPLRKPCRCPSLFTPKITVDGVCECNCLEQDLDCVKLQRGKGYFSVTDRLCIRNDQCALPSCTFGQFIGDQGRCPKKKDIFEATTNRRPIYNYFHRRS